MVYVRISRREGYAGSSMARKKNRKKPSLNETVETLAKIAEEHLATIAEQEQQKRFAALGQRTFTPRRDKRTIQPNELQTQTSQNGASGPE